MTKREEEIRKLVFDAKDYDRLFISDKEFLLIVIDALRIENKYLKEENWELQLGIENLNNIVESMLRLRR